MKRRKQHRWVRTPGVQARQSERRHLGVEDAAVLHQPSRARTHGRAPCRTPPGKAAPAGDGRLLPGQHERASPDGCSGWPDRNQCPGKRKGLADMEGPAVKRFVTAPSISWSMLTPEHRAGERGGIPEDAGARLTMERLRRRIRLICAGCSEEQSRMTPLRRELPPSRGASRPDPETGRRIASARTLQSCPHRAVADAARESRSHYPRPRVASVIMVTRLGAGSRVESWRPR